jgi:photosystem II stability/assembly factor-like uncharacterized protein
MKYLIPASLLLLLHFGAFSQDNWQWLNPQPSGTNCININFADSLNGFILNYYGDYNYNGDLIRTKDQGGHWQVTDHFPQATSIQIADSTGVIACSNGNLYVSSDNGNTWALASASISGNIKSVNIVSRDTFFLASSNNLIYMSTDRGKTLTTLDCQCSVYSSTFLDSKTGFIGAYSSILKTTDGGQTWITLDSFSAISYAGIYSLQFLNADTGFAILGVDTLSRLLRTYDGGATWSELNIGIFSLAGKFINSKTGFAGGSLGEILRTDDGGTTWTDVTPVLDKKFYSYKINSFYFFDEKTGFAVGNSGRILKTINGGQSWSHYSPTYVPITAVSFPTAQAGYMADGYTTFKTKDGGLHWDSLSLTGSSFIAPHFSSADTGYFLSSYPLREHRTIDGGQTWTLFNPASADWAYATGQYYTGPHAGFLSTGGQLLKTVDDGMSWSLVWQAQDSSQFMDLIYFTDSLNGFARRGYAQLMKTTDGGMTWSLTYTAPRGFSKLWFFDPLNGILVGDDAGGQALVTHDGGISFSLVQLTPRFIGRIHAIGFFNRQIGYLTSDGFPDIGKGAYGLIHKTIDGGQTWQLITYDLQGNSIVFTPDSSALIAGNGGQLIKNKISSGWQINSLTASDDHDCGENFSVNVSAALSSVDSISFLYTGPGGRTDTVAASPDQIQNGLISSTGSAKGFIPDTVYTLLVRLRYNGVYQISNPINFTPLGLPQPTIIDSAGYLVSSIDSANHWFRNGIATSSAVGRRYYPDSSGVYTVQTVMDSCISAMSDTILVTVACSSKQSVPAPTVTYNAGILTSSAPQGNHWFFNGVEIPDAYDQQYTPTVPGDYSVRIITPCTISSMSNVVNSLVSSAGAGIRIYPNPAVNQLVIDNRDVVPLEFVVMNIMGQSILSGSSSNNQIYINTRALSHGQYIIRIRNRDTGIASSILFAKF